MVLCSKLRYILAGFLFYKRSITFVLFLVGFWWEIPLVNLPNDGVLSSIIFLQLFVLKYELFSFVFFSGLLWCVSLVIRYPSFIGVFYLSHLGSCVGGGAFSKNTGPEGGLPQSHISNR